MPFQIPDQLQPQMSKGVGMPTILPPAPDVSVATVPPLMPTMNLTADSPATMLNRLP